MRKTFKSTMIRCARPTASTAGRTTCHQPPRRATDDRFEIYQKTDRHFAWLRLHQQGLHHMTKLALPSPASGATVFTNNPHLIKKDALTQAFRDATGFAFNVGAATAIFQRQPIEATMMVAAALQDHIARLQQLATALEKNGRAS